MQSNWLNNSPKYQTFYTTLMAAKVKIRLKKSLWLKCTCQIFQSHEKYSFSVMNFQEITSIKKWILYSKNSSMCNYVDFCLNFTLFHLEKKSKIEHVKLKEGVSSLSQQNLWSNIISMRMIPFSMWVEPYTLMLWWCT